MSVQRFKPPASIWASANPNARHAGEERPDLWETLLDVLDMLDGDAAERLDAALRDPMASEALVTALETWEATDGALEAARERMALPRGAVAVRLREAREALPDSRALADLAAGVVLDATEIEGRLGVAEAKELKRAARAYDLAARRLHHALERAEKAAPKAKARPPDRAKAARLRLAASLCRALGGEIDPAFDAVFRAVYRALVGDDPDHPDPPNMQATRRHLRELKEKGEL